MITSHSFIFFLTGTAVLVRARPALIPATAATESEELSCVLGGAGPVILEGIPPPPPHGTYPIPDSYPVEPYADEKAEETVAETVEKTTTPMDESETMENQPAVVEVTTTLEESSETVTVEQAPNMESEADKQSSTEEPAAMEGQQPAIIEVTTSTGQPGPVEVSTSIEEASSGDESTVVMDKAVTDQGIVLNGTLDNFSVKNTTGRLLRRTVRSPLHFTVSLAERLQKKARSRDVQKPRRLAPRARYFPLSHKVSNLSPRRVQMAPQLAEDGSVSSASGSSNDGDQTAIEAMESAENDNTPFHPSISRLVTVDGQPMLVVPVGRELTPEEKVWMRSETQERLERKFLKKLESEMNRREQQDLDRLQKEHEQRVQQEQEQEQQQEEQAEKYESEQLDPDVPLANEKRAEPNLLDIPESEIQKVEKLATSKPVVTPKVFHHRPYPVGITKNNGISQNSNGNGNY